MKALAPAIFAIYTAFSLQPAFAVEFKYPVLNQYQAQAQKLIEQTQNAKSPSDLKALIEGTQDLVQLGVQILNLYSDKNPNCKAQLNAFYNDLSKMESLPLSEVDENYHGGAILPKGPRHCYFGRSEIVHPVMNIIRLKGEWSDSVKSDVLDDFNEVIEHLPRIQNNLDTPPN